MQVHTVLLVDDDDDIRTIGRISLGTVGGFRVLQAASGTEAIEVARTERPDVILLDVMMPDMDGPMTLRRLREDPVTQGIPVIFLTAKIQPDDVQRYLALGAVGALAKPFDPMALPAEVRALLGHTLH